MQKHHLPICYCNEHLFNCQELFRKRKCGVGFCHNTKYIPSKSIDLFEGIYFVLENIISFFTKKKS